MPVPNPDAATPEPAGRRTFLKSISAAGAAITGLFVGAPALLAFVSPAFRRRHADAWVNVGEAALFDVGVPVKRDFAQAVSDAWVETRAIRSVWVLTEDGETFTAFNGRCTHLGCGYSHDEEKGVFHCPCHHGLFDIKSGKVVGGPPPRPLDTLQVKVEDGYVYVLYQDFRIGVEEKVAV